MAKEGSAKTDAMRKQREEAYAARQRAPKALAPPTPADESPPAPSAPKVSQARKAIASEGKREPGSGEGRCTGCGKLRALKGGLIVAHRKGLTEMCPGSRKEPA